MKACVETGASHVDISGEPEVSLVVTYTEVKFNSDLHRR